VWGAYQGDGTSHGLLDGIASQLDPELDALEIVARYASEEG
jgi:hypothetical protein